MHKQHHPQSVALAPPTAPPATIDTMMRDQVRAMLSAMPTTLCFFGPVACGKTTCITHLAALIDADEALGRSAIVLAEPLVALQKTGLLHDLHGATNTTRAAALRAQLFVLGHRISSYVAATRYFDAPVPGDIAPRARHCVPRRHLAAAVDKQERRVHFLLDGHMSVDARIYVRYNHAMHGTMSAVQCATYYRAHDVVAQLTPRPFDRPDIFVYLRASGAQCAERAHARARNEERALPAQYFERTSRACEYAYVDLVQCMYHTPSHIIVIDTDSLSEFQVLYEVLCALVHIGARPSGDAAATGIPSTLLPRAPLSLLCATNEDDDDDDDDVHEDTEHEEELIAW